MQNNRLIFISIVLALALATLGILVYFYRMKQEKNRALNRQIKEKDGLIRQMNELTQQHTPSIPQNHGNTKQQQIFHRLFRKTYRISPAEYTRLAGTECK